MIFWSLSFISFRSFMLDFVGFSACLCYGHCFFSCAPKDASFWRPLSVLQCPHGVRWWTARCWMESDVLPHPMILGRKGMKAANAGWNRVPWKRMLSLWGRNAQVPWCHHDDEMTCFHWSFVTFTTMSQAPQMRLHGAPSIVAREETDTSQTL